jgi:radical SAM superfamily enzyme YgiQ (UPF0313 family)
VTETDFNTIVAGFSVIRRRAISGTARVADGARNDDGVEVGPYCRKSPGNAGGFGPRHPSLRRGPRAAWPTCCAMSYNYLDGMPDLSSAIPPILPSNLVRLVLTEYSSFDAARGCPFQCSFCTIINVQGPQIALPLRRRRRGDRARQCGAGGHALFRHRRQFRPQPQLGGFNDANAQKLRRHIGSNLLVIQIGQNRTREPIRLGAA